MHVTITTSRNSFDLTFEGKFNFLIGSSGTKKTYLLTSLLKYKRGIRHVKCNVTIADQTIRKNNIHVFSNDFIFDGDYHELFNTKGDIYFIDESCTILHEPDIAKVLLQSKNYFIIISRSLVGWLPISIDSIYKLEEVQNVITNIPVYCKQNEDLTRINQNIEYISTEDSVSSLIVLKNLFHDKKVSFGNTREVIDGKSVSRDNSQLSNIVENELRSGIKNLLIIFDASAFGAYFDSLQTVIDNYTASNISILSWESFEWFLLSCAPWHIRLTKKDVGYNHNSIEQLSEYKLSELINYSKSRSGMPHCLLNLNNVCSYHCRQNCKYPGKFTLNNLLTGSLLIIQNVLITKDIEDDRTNSTEFSSESTTDMSVF